MKNNIKKNQWKLNAFIEEPLNYAVLENNEVKRLRNNNGNVKPAAALRQEPTNNNGNNDNNNGNNDNTSLSGGKRFTAIFKKSIVFSNKNIAFLYFYINYFIYNIIN